MKSLCAASLALLVWGQALGAQSSTATERAGGAILRALDKVSGAVTDLSMVVGDQTAVGALTVRLSDCRFPPGNIQGEAYAWIDVLDGADFLFSGWMVASSPALNPLDHPRYDVWVLRCINS